MAEKSIDIVLYLIVSVVCLRLLWRGVRRPAGTSPAPAWQPRVLVAFGAGLLVALGAAYAALRAVPGEYGFVEAANLGMAFFAFAAAAIGTLAGAFPAARRLVPRAVDWSPEGFLFVGAGLLINVFTPGQFGVVVMIAGLAIGAKDKEAAEARRRQAFFARVSHDLRTPAAAIRALAEALERGDVADPAERTRYLSLVRSEAARLGTGLDRLLRSARGEPLAPLAPVPFDAVEWARRAEERWRVRLPGLAVETPPAPEPVRADPDRLDEAADALLDNAMRHGAPPVVLRVRRAGDEVRIEVSDGGKGVPEARRPEVLDAVAGAVAGDAEKDLGGLGLRSAGEVARAHGGRLELDGGSTLRLRLPAAGAP